MRPDELERLSMLQAGALDDDEARALRAELATRPELQLALKRLEALDEASALLAANVPLDVEGAIARATSPKRRARWPWLVLAAAAAIALGAWWNSAVEVPTEVRRVETVIASVDVASGTDQEELGPRISRLRSGTALYRGEWEVQVADQTVRVNGVALISTNPSEASVHVTSLVTPTLEEKDMIRNATKQWAVVAGLAVFVLAGEVQADDTVKAGQSRVKARAAVDAPSALKVPVKAPDASAPECDTCNPSPGYENENAQEVNVGSSPSLGPVDAKVTVVLFSEAECSFCVKSHSVLKELQKVYGGKVRFVFKHFPLPVHRGARQAAIALHAAHSQGKFWEMVESAYGTPVSSEGGLYDAQARALGLDLQQYRRDVASPVTAAVIDADIAEGKRLGVKGVPAWFINGREVMGHRPVETMRELIDAQLAR